MNIKYRLKALIIISLSFALIIVSSNAFAYWNSIDLFEDNDLNTVNLGQWSSASNTPQGIALFDPLTQYYTYDLVWYGGYIFEYKGVNTTVGADPDNLTDWMFLNDLDWHTTVTYYSGEIVYHNGIIYEAQWTTTGSEPGTVANGPWDSLIPEEYSWTVGQATSLNDVVYHNGELYQFKENYTTTEPGTTTEWSVYGDITYGIDYVYEGGELVTYLGNYYLAGWYTKGAIPTNGGPWTSYSLVTWSTANVYKNIKYVYHNGTIYKALNTKKLSSAQIEPGTAAAKGIWQAYDTADWNQYNTYENGDFVKYNGDVWILANNTNSTSIPGTAADSWNNAGSLDYTPFSTYVVGDYVIYNDMVYEAVNATNANLYAPEVVTDSWNLVSGYDWYWFNTYVKDDIVYYNGTVYTAARTTNQEPGTGNDWDIV